MMVVPVPIRPVRASAWDEPLPVNPPRRFAPGGIVSNPIPYDLPIMEDTMVNVGPLKPFGPRRTLDWQDGRGWVISDSVWSTPDKVLAEAIRAELDRVDPLPSFMDQWYDPDLIRTRRWWE